MKNPYSCGCSNDLTKDICSDVQCIWKWNYEIFYLCLWSFKVVEFGLSCLNRSGSNSYHCLNHVRYYSLCACIFWLFSVFVHINALLLISNSSKLLGERRSMSIYIATAWEFVWEHHVCNDHSACMDSLPMWSYSCSELIFNIGKQIYRLMTRWNLEIIKYWHITKL